MRELWQRPPRRVLRARRQPGPAHPANPVLRSEHPDVDHRRAAVPERRRRRCQRCLDPGLGVHRPGPGRHPVRICAQPADRRRDAQLLAGVGLDVADHRTTEHLDHQRCHPGLRVGVRLRRQLHVQGQGLGLGVDRIGLLDRHDPHPVRQVQSDDHRTDGGAGPRGQQRHRHLDCR